MLNLSSKLDAALSLANHGLSVIPLNPGSKIPCVTWSKYQSQRPTDDELKQWFSNFPDRNLGIVTGAGSGIVVLDVDKPEAFHMSMPRTPTVKTGKGLHYYFRHPGFDVGNAALPFGDLRGDGGQVVAPPSRHPNGSTYEWLVSPDDAPLAELPDELITLAFKPANDNQPKLDYRKAVIETTSYGKSAIEQEAKELARVKSGNRNNQLNIAANKVGSLIASGDLSYNDGMSHLIWACRENGLMAEDARQVGATIKSGIDSGLRNPRQKSEPEIQAPSKPGKLSLIRLSDVKAEKIDWIWPGVLAKGKLSLFAGQGGVGKSTLVADIAARITTGRTWPATEHRADFGDVVIIQLEDGLGDTVLPRFLAAGGDVTRVHVVSTVEDEKTGSLRPFNLQSDLAPLAEQIKALPNVRLIVIDPIMGYMGNLNPDKADQVRKITTPLQVLAQDVDASILIIAHNNKSEDKRAINSVQGSGAFVQAVRSAFNVYKDANDPDRRILAPLKSNFGKDDRSFAFTIQPKQITSEGLDVDTTVIAWEAEAHKGTAEDALQKSRDVTPMVRSVMDFIRAMLKEGPMLSSDIADMAEAQGFSPSSLQRARENLPIQYNKDDNDKRRIYWSLPVAA